MKTWVRKSLNVGVLSAGFLLISGGAAHADWTTGYNAGLLNGNQFDTTLQLPINVCGNSIAVLGFADASCGGGAAAIDTESATTEDWTTGYNAGVANGNQFDTTLQVPVNVSGNAVSVLGFSQASSQGGAYAVKGGMASDNGRGNGHGHGRGHGHGGGNGNGGGNSNGGYAANNNGGYAANAMGDYTEGAGNRTEDWTSGYNAGVLNGNQFDSTLQLPINLSGNAISLFGFSSAQSTGGAWAVKGESASTESATTEDWTTGYNAGLLNGNQFDTTLQAPINVCGNAIAVLGFSSASCGGGAVAVDGDGWGGGNGGGNGNGNGHGHGHHGNGGGNGDWDDDWDDNNGGGNGGYGDADADGDGYGGDANANDDGYGAGNNNANPNAYGNAAGNASNMSSHGASASHGKAKTKKVSSEHGRGNGHGNGNGHGTGTANDGGYGGQNNGGYSNGNGNSNNDGDDDGYNGGGNGDGDGDGGWGNGGGNGHGHGHHGNGNGNGNGGGAMAVKNSCSDWTTGYNAGLLNGNQFDTTLQVPVNISGNAISLFGFSQASSQGGAVAYSC